MYAYTCISLFSSSNPFRVEKERKTTKKKESKRFEVQEISTETTSP